MATTPTAHNNWPKPVGSNKVKISELNAVFDAQDQDLYNEEQARIQGDATTEANVVGALSPAIAGKQAADADLTAIAALDSAQAGVVSSDGAGWLRKTYAQLKTALNLTKSDVGLNLVNNTSDVDKVISTATQTALDNEATARGNADAALRARFLDQGAAKTASYSMAVWHRATYNTTAGAISQALPAGAVAGDEVQVYLATGTNTLTLTGTGGPFTVSVAGHGVTLLWTGSAWVETQDRKTLTALDGRYRSAISALDPIFGVVGDGVADDTGGLRAWAAAANGKRAYLPRGTYKITGPIVFTDTTTEVFGDGIRSKLAPVSNTTSGLVLGDPANKGGTANNSVTADAPGGALFSSRVHGSIRDIYVATGTTPPAIRSGSIGIQAISTPQVTIERCIVEGFDVAFDLNGNCYGAEMKNCRALFSMNNVGLNIRTGPTNGADQHFSNNWLGGRVAAVYAHGGGGGLHFFSGQFTGANNETVQNDEGVLVLNKDYFTQAILDGLNNMTFVGVSWEGWHKMWAIRSYGEATCHFESANFNETSGASADCKGIWKGTDLGGSSYSFINCAMGGSFYNTTGKLADLQGVSNSAFNLIELGWRQTNQTTKVDNGTAIDVKKITLAVQGSYTNTTTFGITGNGVYVNGKLAWGVSNDLTNVRSLAITGLTGATSASRLVGATASGAPASGTFSVGDVVHTLDGHSFIYTAGGWVDVSQPMNRRSVSAAATAAFNDEIVADTTSGAYAIALPAAANVNQQVTITNIGANTLTLTGTVSGVLNPVLPQWESRTIRSTASVLYFI